MVASRVRRAPSVSGDLGEWRARDLRWWAAVIDVWLVSSLVGGAAGVVVTVAVDTQAFGALIVAPFLMAAEARTGRTPGIRGLEVRVASSGMTTGRSEGRDDRIVDVTTGPGLGELVIDCRPQWPDAT